MSLKENLINIKNPKIEKIQDRKYKNLESFWEGAIEPLLPQTEVALEWHKTLIKYIELPDSFYPIRGFNSGKKENYKDLRRGFISSTNSGTKYFYTDNFHAFYYYKLIFNKVTVSAENLRDAYVRKEFPARFGRSTSDERQLPGQPLSGKDPGISASGYKLSHILPVGKEYHINNENINMNSILSSYFPRGEREDWVPDSTFQGHFIRFVDDLPSEAHLLLKAHMLRFIHPFNHVLTPKKSIARLNGISFDIGEYKGFLDFAQEKMKCRYGESYLEFYEKVFYLEKESEKNQKYENFNFEIDKSLSNTDIFSPDSKLNVIFRYITEKNCPVSEVEKEVLFSGAENSGREKFNGYYVRKIRDEFGFTTQDKGNILSMDALRKVEGRLNIPDNFMQNFEDYLQKNANFVGNHNS